MVDGGNERKLFHPRMPPMSAEDMRRHAMFEIAHTAADFTAALSFVIGSVMFFFSAWIVPGTWFFLVGSVLFALKPTIKLWREVDYVRRGRVAVVAEKDGAL